jgi:hypothetical protein
MTNLFYKFVYSKLIFLFLFSLNFSISALDSTSDVKKTADTINAKILDNDYVPKEALKRPAVIYEIGGAITSKSRITFQTFQLASSGGVEPVPNDQWDADLTAKLWMKIAFERNRFFYLIIL